MAAPFKRLCLRAARQQTARQWHSKQQQQQPQLRYISSTPSKSATTTTEHNTNSSSGPPTSNEQPSDADLDRLINKPGVTYTSTEEPDDLGSLEIDALSSQAQRGLAAHRELREIVRLAAWEMPKLTALSQPFTAPDPATQYLSWRYTTYMGELHPAEAKVVLEFKPENLPDMTAAQREKLIKIAGVRYNPNTRAVKMSCESFANQAQNKRFLADTLNALVAEAKDPNADSFADVPYDTRHVKVKERLEFPEEWKMTTQRRAQLDARRNQMLRLEASKVEQGEIVSGTGAIEEARRLQLVKEQEAALEASMRQPETVPAGRGGRSGASSRQGPLSSLFPPNRR